MYEQVTRSVPTLEQMLAEIADERDALRAENERLRHVRMSNRALTKMCDDYLARADTAEARVAELAEALSQITAVESIDVDGLWEEFPALTRAEMFDIARAALAGREE